jgi:hypothetical protein
MLILAGIFRIRRCDIRYLRLADEIRARLAEAGCGVEWSEFTATFAMRHGGAGFDVSAGSRGMGPNYRVDDL